MAACAAAMLPWTAALALPMPTGELEQRCWLAHSRERTRVDLREPTAVLFSNLRDGYEVASPFLVEFAVRGMGVVPAGTKMSGTGHHHILVDRTLPPSISDKLPFDNSHRHFGKGQTATTIDLPPGKHTLRLLFADHDHVPYFVFSREIAITVRGPRASTPRPAIEPAQFEASCERWYQDEVSRPRPAGEPLYFANLRADEPLTSPINLRLAVDGLGVSARGGPADKTGHFVVEVLAAGTRAVVQTYNLANGATQVNAFLGVGDYRLRLHFVNDKGVEVLPPHELPVRVTAQERY